MTIFAIVAAIAFGALVTYAVMRRPNGRNAAVAIPEPPKPDRSRGDADFRRLVRALPLGVIFVDRESHVRFANPAAATIFGFDLGRALGSHVLTAIPNVDLERRVADAIAGEASVAPVSLTAGGRRRTYGVSVYPLMRDDEAEGAVIFAEDQTDAVSLERARKEFLSNVSHELRTPLSSIKLMLETVIESPDDEAGDIFLPQILAQVDRLTALVQQLLDQARAESGQLKLNLREIDLEAVANPIVSSFEPQAASKGVHIELQTVRPARVEADPDRLAQIFVNLVDNALRHTPERGRVIVELDVQDADAIIRVRDTGVGIPYRDIPHIFERFYVVDRSRTRESGGAGLGLAIVKGIVDAHGGTIATESMLGRGTVFTVRLPIMRISKREA